MQTKKWNPHLRKVVYSILDFPVLSLSALWWVTFTVPAFISQSTLVSMSRKVIFMSLFPQREETVGMDVQNKTSCAYSLDDNLAPWISVSSLAKWTRVSFPNLAVPQAFNLEVVEIGEDSWSWPAWVWSLNLVPLTGFDPVQLVSSSQFCHVIRR